MKNLKKVLSLERLYALGDCYQPFKWEPLNVLNLPIPENYQAFTIDHIPFGSNEKKIFGAVTFSALGALLWLTSRQQFSEKHTMRYYQRMRPCFSDESVQPIHILIWNQKDFMLRRYNPYNHTLEDIKLLSPKKLRAAYRAVDIQQGELIMLVAEPGKAPSRIKDRDQQLWRDTHIIRGYLSLAAEMLQLEFVSLAMTGENLIYPLDILGRLHGVGISIVGSK
jgi:hypothetical protein